MHDLSHFYGFSDFIVGADISAELKCSWQVWDVLSRKNISDPAEHLRQTQNLKTRNNVILCTNHVNSYIKCMIWVTFMDFPILLWEQIFLLSWNVLDKSQMFCQGKISGTPQSTFIGPQNSKLRITWYCVPNHIKSWNKCMF